MEGGAAYFIKEMPYHYELEGDIDGVKFSVRGEGSGDANKGIVKGKYVCTTGVLPTSWVSLVTTLSYGAKCFVKYPGGIKDFFKSCFPEGYIQERTLQFENDGVYTTRAELTYKDGAIYNKTTLNGVGFNKDGAVLGKQLKSMPPSVSFLMPHGEGIKLIDSRVYTLKNGEFTMMSTVQKNKPIKPCSGDVPKYHHIYEAIELSIDTSETKDHIIVHETIAARDPNCLNF